MSDTNYYFLFVNSLCVCYFGMFMEIITSGAIDLLIFLETSLTYALTIQILLISLYLEA